MDIHSNESNEYEVDNDSNDVPSKSAIFPSLKQIFVGIAISLFLICLLEKLFVTVFLYFIPSYLLLTIVMIIIHLFILRYVIYLCIFPGKNTLVNFYLRTVFGKIRAKSFERSLEKFKDKITKILSYSNEMALREGSVGNSQTISKSKVSSKYIDIYTKIKQKYGTLSSYSQNFLDHLSEFKSKIENSSLQENFNKYAHREEIVITQKDKQDYTNILTECDKIKEILDEVISEDAFQFKKIPNYLINLFRNDILKSREFTRVSAMLKKPNSKELPIMNNDNKKIDSLLIFSENKADRECSSNLVIVCGPNLTPFENLINSWDIDSLYLTNDTDILFWNYRGYGFSPGSADFTNVCDDILSIYDYMSKNYSYNKIAVHGLSVGGVPACHLAKNRNINLIIADRTFGSAQDVIDSFPLGKILYFLGKIIFFNFVDNTEKFMKANCKKILMNDAEDRTIVDPISLKTSIAKSIIKAIFSEYSPELNTHKINSGNILDYALEPNQIKEIYSSFNYTIEFLQNKSSKIELEQEEKEEQYQKLNENQENIDTGNRAAGNREIYDILFNRIKNCYSRFFGVGESLESFVTYQNTEVHFNNFFNNLVIFGPDDESIQDYSLCSIEYLDKIFTSFIQEAESIFSYEEVAQNKNLSVYKNFYQFVEYVKIIKTFLLSLHLKEKENQFYSDKKGILIPLYCGHILFYDDKELETLKYLIKNSLTTYDIIFPSIDK